MNKGYKGMLRDRLVPSWNLALLWCKVKNRWVDTVYENVISKTPKALRPEITKFSAGLKNKYGVVCPFMSTVDPDGWLYGENKKEYEMWRAVYSWINWFAKNQMIFYSDYEHYSKFGYSEEEIIKKLTKPGITEKLCKFMIKHKHIYYGTS